MKILSIIIPVYNEKDTILAVLKRIGAIDIGLDKQIIIIDDGSTDGSQEILDNVSRKYKVILKKQNEGKGAAVKEGLLASTGDYVLIQDADLEYNPADYSTLLSPLLEDLADVVYGSRFVGGQPHRVLYFWHYVGNKFITTLSNMFTNLNLTDMETGYKAFNRSVVDAIKNKVCAKRFGIEPEITALVANLNFRIYEVGISYQGRSYEQGKKITARDGFAAIYYILKHGLFR